MPTNRCHILRGALFACPRSVRACARTAGFTLIELLIVIGIIGILSGVLISQFGGATESARAAECLTHMRNLANAVQNYGMAHDWYPEAGDVEYIGMYNNDIRYRVHKGFITRYAIPNPYENKGGASSHQSLQTVSPYCKEPEQSRFCVTNGAIWAYGARKMDEYVCPSHKRLISSQGLVGPAWSYVMNPYFGYDYSDGSETTGAPNPDVKYGRCKRPDRRLLFAELQWETSTGIEPKFDEGPTPFLDGVLHCDSDENSDVVKYPGQKEAIGFNHKAGLKYVAHVCFADGHTEKLAMPGSGSTAELIEMTKFLCQADDIRYSGGRWERVHKTSDE